MAQERSGENCASKQQHSVTILGFLKVTKNVDFSLLIHIRQLLFVTFCDTTAAIRSETRWDGRTAYERKDANIEAVMWICYLMVCLYIKEFLLRLKVLLTNLVKYYLN